MAYIENGSRYAAVRAALDEQPSVVVVNEVTTSRVDGRKLNAYDATRIIVAPKHGIDAAEIPAFTGNLLPDVKPIFRHEADQGRLRTFDTLGNRQFRPITIEVLPSVPTQENAE